MSQLRDTRTEIRRRVDQAFMAAMCLGIVGGVAFFVGIGLFIGASFTLGS